MTNIGDSTIRVILFDGEQSSWSPWKEKFLARARKKGYKEILKKKVKVVGDNETIADDDPEKSTKMKNRELNDEAYGDLVLSMKTDVAAGRVAAEEIQILPENVATAK